MPSSPIETMYNTLPQTGKIEWIGLRPARRNDLQVVDEAEISLEDGLVGDHYSGESRKRQVTLIQAEHLQGVANILGLPEVDPGLIRRNIVVSGINLQAFDERQFAIGEVILEMTGQCHPCSRMEENLGPGGFNAMRGHGGITARVIKGGRIRVGDPVMLAETVPALSGT
ncbi:MAG: MOSC domain-containing protein [Lewinellaceae bacterium]|nr:MOSC domain-containing protein [Lewinella sp.]MCB9278797.1 MOSC domain-containing protein [Lewinellaceae bacterium]